MNEQEWLEYIALELMNASDPKPKKEFSYENAGAGICQCGKFECDDEYVHTTSGYQDMDVTWYQETTDWKYPNHTYALNKNGWAVAYIKRGTDTVIEFQKPLKQFSKSRRKFKKVIL